jgi:hypothetical protein
VQRILEQPEFAARIATRFGCLGVVVLCTLAGCSGPKREFAEVEGKVTLNGKPLAGAIVRFYPVSEDTKQLPFATGRTDAMGVYQLSSQVDKPGALVGSHRAVVYWPPRDRQGGAGGPSRPDRPIPLKYTVASDSPLVVEVKAGELQTIDLSLQE